MYANKQLDNIYCVFDIPFHIAIPDTIDINNKTKPTDEIFIQGETPVGICTVAVNNPGIGLQIGGDIEEGDPYGRCRHSRIQVRFNRSTAHEFTNWNDNLLIENAVQAVNRLINNYRDIFSRPIINHLHSYDIVHFKIVFEFKDNKPFSRIIAKTRGPATFGFNQSSLEKLHKLRLRLQTTEDVQFLRSIELEMQRFLLLSDYRMAAVTSALLFEAWLKRLLEKRFIELGFDEEEISKIFENDGLPKSIYSIAKHLIPEAYDFDFVNSAQGKNWASNCKDLRNNIIHGKCELVTKEMAEKSGNAVYEANSFISKRIRDVTSLNKQK